MRSPTPYLTTVLLAIASIQGAAIVADANNDDISLSTIQEKPESQQVLADVPTASQEDQVAPLPVNKTDTIIVEASTTHATPEGDSVGDIVSRSPKVKKPHGNKNSSNNSTDDDNSAGVGRDASLPISLAIGLVILVASLQM